MILQIIGSILALIGFFSHTGWLFIIAGFLFLFLDIISFLSGKLNPTVPLILYIGGLIVFEDWTGILWGAVIGNLLDIGIFLIVGLGAIINSIFQRHE